MVGGGCGWVWTETTRVCYGFDHMRDSSFPECHTDVTERASRFAPVRTGPGHLDPIDNVLGDHQPGVPQTLGGIWPIGSREIDPSQQALQKSPQ